MLNLRLNRLFSTTIQSIGGEAFSQFGHRDVIERLFCVCACTHENVGMTWSKSQPSRDPFQATGNPILLCKQTKTRDHSHTCVNASMSLIWLVSMWNNGCVRQVSLTGVYKNLGIKGRLVELRKGDQYYSILYYHNEFHEDYIRRHCRNHGNFDRYNLSKINSWSFY